MKEITKERAMIAAAYWLDMSPHEQTQEDGIILAQYCRQLMDELVEIQEHIVSAPTMLFWNTQIKKAWLKKNKEWAERLYKEGHHKS